MQLYKSESDVRMIELRKALQVLDIPKSIKMQYYERSICFKSLDRKRTVKVDCYFFVYVDYPVKGNIKSVTYKFKDHKETVQKTLELMYAWIAREELKIQLVVNNYA